ncbi:MAG: sulfur carrier protein ThiS [Bacteroidales bacterium]|nr:sulfur carrier protein ThiS [Bacteroidales bacterium]
MKITLNNREDNIDNFTEISIRELLKVKAYSFKLLVIKINGNLVPRDEYDKAIVRDGDYVTILHLMSGG